MSLKRLFTNQGDRTIELLFYRPRSRTLGNEVSGCLGLPGFCCRLKNLNFLKYEQPLCRDRSLWSFISERFVKALSGVMVTAQQLFVSMLALTLKPNFRSKSCCFGSVYIPVVKAHFAIATQ